MSSENRVRRIIEKNPGIKEKLIEDNIKDGKECIEKLLTGNLIIKKEGGLHAPKIKDT